MRTASSFIMAVCLVTLAACSSTPTRIDRGPVRAHTFNFMERGRGPLPSYADDNQSVHAMIQDAITRNLASRGIARVAQGGEVLVGYLIITGDNASTQSINDYFGYREDAAALHDKAHAAYTGRETTSYFEAGTLVVDLVDPKTSQVLKRGYATRPLLRNPPENVRATRIQQVVDDILGDLRVAQ